MVLPFRGWLWERAEGMFARVSERVAHTLPEPFGRPFTIVLRR